MSACIPRRASPALLGGCQVCHADVAHKLTGTRHARATIGCITCHGRSRAHARDETGKAHPDRVFKGLDVDEHCNACHLETCLRCQARRHHAPPRTCSACHDPHAARIPPKP